MANANAKTAGPNKADAIARIAAEAEIETLETRMSDSLDFHELAVWRIKAMLDAAYEAGYEAAALAGKGRK